MDCIAIRSVYHFGCNINGINIFEERIVAFMAKDTETAHKKGRKEAEKYALDNEFELHAEQSGYKQDGNSLVDGYEIWSELFEADLSLNEFYKKRYEQYLYNPKNA